MCKKIYCYRELLSTVLALCIFREAKMVSQQYRAWSDCTDVQAGLTWLYTGGKD